MKEEENKSQQAVAHIHFEDGLELYEVITALVGVDHFYSELAWLDSALEEAIRLSDSLPDAFQKRHREERTPLPVAIAKVAARNLITLSKHPDFDAVFAVRRTRAAARIAGVRAEGSWVVDLVGKLNPIESLRQILELIRDWRADNRHKELLNSKLAQDVLAMEIANKASEVDVVQRTVQLLRDAEYPKEEIDTFLHARIASMSSSALQMYAGSKGIEVTRMWEYDFQELPERQKESITYATQKAEALPSVWDASIKRISSE